MKGGNAIPQGSAHSPPAPYLRKRQRTLSITHIFWRFREEHIGASKVREPLEAAPDGHGSWMAVTAAPKEATKLGHPTCGLLDGGRGLRRIGALVDLTPQRLPLFFA